MEIRHCGYWKLPISLLPLLLAGCAAFPSARQPAAPTITQPLIKGDEAIELIFPEKGDLSASAAMAILPDSSQATTLTLDQIQEIARRENPTFKEFSANRAAAGAEVLQALAYPNPELEAGLGIATTREDPRESAWEIGLGLFQALEWPAKRKARREAAEAWAPVVQREEDVFRSMLRADVAKAYYTVLYSRHAAELARSALRTEQEIEAIVRRRVEGGEAPPIDLTRARVETLKAGRLVQGNLRQCETARAVLNTLAGRALPPRFTLADTLEQPMNGVDLDQARRIALAQNPALRRLDAVLRQRELAIGRERTAWYPDLKLGLSPVQELDTRGLGASVGMELPLWNRNQGGIAAAQAELQQAMAELERARQEVLRDLETGVQSYESAREQLAAFDGGLLEAGAESLRLATFLYQEGEADLLQLLDARRTARQIETEHLQALYDTQVARAELERAIGIGGEE